MIRLFAILCAVSLCLLGQSAPVRAANHWETCDMQFFRVFGARISIRCKGTSKPFFSAPTSGNGAIDAGAWIPLLTELQDRGKPFRIRFVGGVENSKKGVWERRPNGCHEKDCFRLNGIEVK